MTSAGPITDDAVAAARSGDPHAFAALWRRHAPAVAAYARARGAQEPDDLTSEVFIAAFRRLNGFTGGEDAFKAFLFTVAHRRVVDELRTRARRPGTVGWSPEDDGRTSSSAEECALVESATSDVRRALDSLPPAQRDVLVLRILGDLTVVQVAEALGKRSGAVKALQRRGMESLRRQLAQQQLSGREG